jgi:hypothetical protein
MNRLSKIVAVLLLAVSGFAQSEIPEAPKPRVVTKDFVLVHAIQALGMGLDTGFSNSRLTSPNRVCYETNPLFQNKDKSFNTSKAIAVHSLIFGGGSLIIDYAIRRGARKSRDSKFIRILMDGIVSSSSAGNWYEDGRWLSGTCR